MPLNYVQIAPYGRYDGFVNSPFHREIQLKSMNQLDHVGKAVTLDIGEDKSIHPAGKIKLG